VKSLTKSIASPPLRRATHSTSLRSTYPRTRPGGALPARRGNLPLRRRRTRDYALIGRTFSRRLTQADSLPAGLAQTLADESIVSSFCRRLTDVKAQFKKGERILAKEELTEPRPRLRSCAQGADSAQKRKTC
jgi:hypothetical protein